jgi:hypothetical protein
MSDDHCAEQRRYCYEALARLERDYREAAKPFVDMLVRMEAMNPRPIIVSLAHAEAFFSRPVTPASPPDPKPAG